MSDTRMLSVVGFASGSPLSMIVMSRVAKEHNLLGIVMPQADKKRFEVLQRLFRRVRNPFREIGIPLLGENQLRGMNADILLVATFPRILSRATLACARIGRLNVHAAPLPRHRGPHPIFWTYMDDDSHAGVTIHWMDAGIDTGEIAAISTLPLDRGRPSRELYFDLAERAATLVSSVLTQIAHGAPPRTPQATEGESYQSAKDTAEATVPFATWPSERTWHVLRGLGDQFSGLVRDSTGARLAHGQATAYRLTNDVRPGAVELSASGFELHCHDGIVSVDRHEPAGT
jgi:methionyl-tRNA formyltransferase